MIKQLSLQNFKSFEKTDIPLKQLTILTGLNSSGKSSVMQAMRMLTQYQNTKNCIIEDHGYLEELRNNKTPEEKFTIGVASDSSDFALTINAPKGESHQVQVKGGLDISCTYLSADRLGPRSYLPMNISGASDVGIHGEYVIDFLHRYGDELINEALCHENSQGDTLRYNTESWLQEISPHTKFEYNTIPSHSYSYSTFNSFRSANVGFGLSYTLPVIVSALGACLTEQNILMVENPEAHLHPKGQTDLGKLFARTASAGTQVIIETHSDHFIDGIRIAVKNGLISFEDCIIHFFKIVNGITRIETIKLNKSGKISKWPEGFFDQGIINKSELMDLD